MKHACICQTFFVILGLILGVSALFMTLGFAACITDPQTDIQNSAPTSALTESIQSDSQTVADFSPSVLLPTPDAGMAYIDKLVFIGESTTSHLASRSVLTGGKETEQVWSKADNTRTLSSKTTSEIINSPDVVSGFTIAEACAEKKPQYIVLSFGLNGISNFIGNKSAYLNNYGALIKAIQNASPDTRIILQTVYPITKAKEGTASPFSDVEATNCNISILNSWLPELAEAYENVRICDTASVLLDSNRQLKDSYNTDDGIHLTADAYREILFYLRTHAWN